LRVYDGILLFSCVLRASAQVDESPTLPARRPKCFSSYASSSNPARSRNAANSRSRVLAPHQLAVPNSWIDLEFIFGSPEALFFDSSIPSSNWTTPFWNGAAFASRPDIARVQEEIQALVSTERTMIVVRGTNLGYRPQSIDFSKARFMRVLEVRLNPGHETEFVEAFRILTHAYETIKANTPWVVYQVNVGMPLPAFIVFLPMRPSGKTMICSIAPQPPRSPRRRGHSPRRSNRSRCLSLHGK